MGNMGSVISEEMKSHGQPYSAEFVLPPLSIIVFRPEPAPVKEIETPIIEASHKVTLASEGGSAESEIAVHMPDAIDGGDRSAT